MASFNKVILIGNLTRDPELRYTPKGMAIAKIGLAVNRTWRNEAGETKEEVTFVDVDAFGRQAETLAQYMKKGSPLMIEGRLKLDQWDDKQTGQKRSKLGVVVEGFQFLGGGNRGEGGGETPAPRRSAPAPAAPSAAAASEPDMPPPEEDDVPF
ncbi:MAG TPA: single-stranded DNA-binding protein [Candidatus Paceibacterota bacterium]|nr:single-stranded DNA-binding protein [Candidatus Paceibacterota bacterium]